MRVLTSRIVKTNEGKAKRSYSSGGRRVSGVNSKFKKKSPEYLEKQLFWKVASCKEIQKIRIPESGKVSFVESGIPETTGMQNPSSSDLNWNRVPGIWNPRCGIQNLRHGAVERVIILQRIFYVAVKRRRWIELKLKGAKTMVLKMAFGVIQALRFWYNDSFKKPLNILTSGNTTANLNSLKIYDHASVFINNLLRSTA